LLFGKSENMQALNFLPGWKLEIVADPTISDHRRRKSLQSQKGYVSPPEFDSLGFLDSSGISS
jgi:hypothetical protein